MATSDGYCRDCDTNEFSIVCMKCEAGANGASKCTECAAGYRLTEEGECKTCGTDYSCKRCSAEMCTECMDGYYLDTTGECQKCSDTLEFCNKCSSPYKCDRCNNRVAQLGSEGKCTECNSQNGWYKN